MHKPGLFAILLVLLIASPLASITGAQAPLVPERILLTFIPNVQFSPYYLGIEQGIFAEAGFDVSLEHLQEPEVLDLVAVGRANYGIVSGEQVILARSRGRDVVYIFEWFQQYPVGLVHRQDLDLSELDKLRGLVIGIPGRFGASYSGLTTLLMRAGLSEADIEISEIGFNAPEVFCLGAVDAAVVYANNEPLQIQRLIDASQCDAAEAIAVLKIAEQVDLVSNGLIVSRAYMQEAPDEIARMVGALGEALRIAIENPAAAYLASLPHVDTLPADEALVAALAEAAELQADFLATNPSRAQIAESRQDLLTSLAAKVDSAALAQFEVLLSSIDFWDADTLGYTDLASWQAMRDTLASMDLLGADLGDLNAAFSNDFIAVDSE